MLMSGVKGFFSKYIAPSANDLKLDPDSFRDESVWEKVIE